MALDPKGTEKEAKKIPVGLYLAAGATIAGVFFMRDRKSRGAMRETAKAALRGAIATMEPRRAPSEPIKLDPDSTFARMIEQAKRHATPSSTTAPSVESADFWTPNARSL